MNSHSSDGIAEDLIRSFVQMGCSEVHAKTLYEKAVGDLENKVDGNDDDAVKKQVEKIDRHIKEIGEYASLRRKLMLYLFNMYDGDKSYWCLVKHLGISAYTLFEAYQANEDPELLDLAMEANKAFTKALSAFLGTEITDCAACFADMLKEKI